MQPRQFFLACLLLLAVFPAVGAAPGEAPGDIRYERQAGGEGENTESIPPSIFPHWVHRINYRCDACHDSLFEMKRGGTPVSKELMKQGEVCGACHNGNQAFAATLQTCNRCHVSDQE